MQTYLHFHHPSLSSSSLRSESELFCFLPWCCHASLEMISFLFNFFLFRINSLQESLFESRYGLVVVNMLGLCLFSTCFHVYFRESGLFWTYSWYGRLFALEYQYHILFCIWVWIIWVIIEILHRAFITLHGFHWAFQDWNWVNCSISLKSRKRNYWIRNLWLYCWVSSIGSCLVLVIISIFFMVFIENLLVDGISILWFRFQVRINTIFVQDYLALFYGAQKTYYKHSGKIGISETSYSSVAKTVILAYSLFIYFFYFEEAFNFVLQIYYILYCWPNLF